jgi:hypothetical protein
MHQEWRELKSAPENGLKLLVEAHAENDQPDVIMPQPLPEEELKDLLVLASMPAHMKNYWQFWIETPFGNQDLILPEDWTENFWLKFDDDSSDSEVSTTSDCEAFSTKEKDVHVVHHPSVIPTRVNYSKYFPAEENFWVFGGKSLFFPCRVKNTKYFPKFSKLMLKIQNPNLVAVLPKKADLYSTHKFCPISLLNTDYKLVMRVWANRLGPILARKIGHHYRGFIPGRDSRENIVNVQMIINMINAKNEEGAVAFLDQEKAFDMVSFTIINAIFAKLNWPKRFKAVLSTTYRNNYIRAKVKANGITSKNDFLVNSGTKQGCPISPLIYMVVANLYNMAVINQQCFKSHETLPGQFVKISAYANDIAVYLGAIADIKIYCLLLCQYWLATGGVTNFNKSERVLCGAWRLSNLGISMALASKYLGVITECDSTLASKAIVDKQIDAWDTRLSSSPIDRVMVAKII